MKVTLKQSGGFAMPLANKKIVVDTQLLPEVESSKLKNLIDQDTLKKLNTQKFHSSKGADLMNYELIVETDDDVYNIDFDDMSIPKNITTLFEYLMKKS